MKLKKAMLYYDMIDGKEGTISLEKLTEDPNSFLV